MSDAAEEPPAEKDGTVQPFLPRVWATPPHPPAEESYKACERQWLLSRLDDGEYVALQRGRRSPHDDGIIRGYAKPSP